MSVAPSSLANFNRSSSCVNPVTINRSKVDKRNPSLEFYAGDRGRINVDKYDNTEILQFGDSGKASYTKDGIPYHGIYRAENK